jgi:hypothetical protein
LKTFSQLKQNVRDRLWPSGDPENLAGAHDKMVVEALIDIQRLVDCFQYNNTQLVPACSTLFQSGMTVFDAPRGIIRALHIVDRVTSAGVEDATAALDWTGRILYRQVPFPELEQTALGPEPASCRNLLARLQINCNLISRKFTAPTDADYGGDNPLPLGFHYSQSSTDASSGRALQGVWAHHRGRIYVFPWIQSTETVMIEWDGLKREFLDDDVIDDDPSLEKAVVLYVEKEHARLYDADYERARQLESDYVIALRDLVMDCREETIVRDREASRARQQNKKYSIGTGVVPASEVDYETDTSGEESRIQNGCPSVSPVLFYPAAGSQVGFPTKLILNSNGSGTIRYTANGSTPTKDSPAYTAPLTILEGMTVKAALFDSGGCTSPVNYSAHGPYQNGDEFEFYRRCTRVDKAGAWHVFEAGGSQDWNWRLRMSVSDPVEIRRVDVWQTNAAGEWASGQAWSTNLSATPPDNGTPFDAYPLVIYSGGSQLNFSYVGSLGTFTDTIEWDLYGDTVLDVTKGYYFLVRVFTDIQEAPIEQLILADSCGNQCCSGRCGTVTLSDDTLEIELAADTEEGLCEGGGVDEDAPCVGSVSRTQSGNTAVVVTSINGVSVTLTFKLTENGDSTIWALDSASAAGDNTVEIEGWTSETSTDEDEVVNGKPYGSATVYLLLNGDPVYGNLTVLGPETCFTTTTTTTTSTTTTSSTTTTTSTTTTPAPVECAGGETAYQFAVTVINGESDGECSPGDTDAYLTRGPITADVWIHDSDGTIVDNGSLTEDPNYVAPTGFGTVRFAGCLTIPADGYITWSVIVNVAGCRYNEGDTYVDNNDAWSTGGTGLPGDMSVTASWDYDGEQLQFE